MAETSHTPLIHVRGKVAIVTGASRGIGEAIATELARAGAIVVLAARKPEALEQVAERIRAFGGTATPVACHTGKQEDIARLVAGTVKDYGGVDVLVNNAATNPYFGPLVDADMGAWKKTFEVNLEGYYATSRAVAKHLVAVRKPGSIINVASVVGFIASPLQGIYAMTKAAVISMTKTLSMELGGVGIRVNAIAPGLVETRFAAALTENAEIRNMVLERTALKRIGQPIDIAGPALFLASDASSYVTGHTLVVDGGWTVA